MKALLGFGRDRLVALVAIFVFGISALPFIGWFADIAEILPRAPDPLSALSTPITILYQSPGTNGTNAMPSLVWVPLVLALLVGLASFLSNRLRRILYILVGIVGIGLLVLLFVQFGRYVSAADASGTFSYIAPGQFIFAGACVLSVLAGILVPAAGKRGGHDSVEKALRSGPEAGAHDRNTPPAGFAPAGAPAGAPYARETSVVG